MESLDQAGLAKIESALDASGSLSPERITSTALDAIHRAFCDIRAIASNEPGAAGVIADAFHNLPKLLDSGDYQACRKETVRAIYALGAKDPLAGTRTETAHTVLHLTGRTGVGKTSLLQKFITENPGSIQILSPEQYGQQLDASIADWDNHAAIAVDEVTTWDNVSVAAGIAALETQADELGKKLIVVSQVPEDLEHCGVVLRNLPVILQLDGRMQGVCLSFDGQHLNFVAESN